METGLTILAKKFEGKDVKLAQGKDGEILFELYSTGAALGYTRTRLSKGREYTQIMEDRIDKVMMNGAITGLQHDGATYLNEVMLYDFILESKTKNGREFRKWVTEDVLPAIRKTGGYVAPGISSKDVYLLDLAKSMQLTNQVVQGMFGAIDRMEEFVKDSLNSKDLQIDQTADMIGFRDRNTKVLSSTLKDKLSEIYGRNIDAKSQTYIKAKDKVFKEYMVYKWEDIAVSSFSKVHAFIDTLDISQLN